MGPNILFIGTASDPGAIDGSLLGPGHLEARVEIPLPNESGRYQILNIHTSHLRANGIIDGDVDLQEIARLTTNFSGAEITGLIRCAMSFAFNRQLKVKTASGVPSVQDLRVKREDFVRGLEEISPAFGISDHLKNVIQNDIIPYDHVVDVSLCCPI